MRELQIFQAILQKDVRSFIVSDEIKTSMWKEIIRKALRKVKRERGMTNEL